VLFGLGIHVLLGKVDNHHHLADQTSRRTTGKTIGWFPPDPRAATWKGGEEVSVSCLEESRLALAGPAVADGPLGQSSLTWVLWLLAISLAVIAFSVVRRRRRA
jgi:hypothetical protein